LIENKKESMENKEVLRKSPSKRWFSNGTRSLIRQADTIS